VQSTHLFRSATKDHDVLTHLEDRNFGVLQRYPEPASPRKHIHKPRPGFNDISVLSKSSYGRSLGLGKAVN
jgi:hypothetical protein